LITKLGGNTNNTQLKNRGRNEPEKDQSGYHNLDDIGYESRSKGRRHHLNDDNYQSRGRRKRHDSGDDESRSKERRRRHDSDDDESTPKEKRRRHDSDDDESGSKERRRRHDSDSGASSESGEDNTSAKKMSSGHSAGLQNTSQFKKAEALLQEKSRKEAKKVAEQNGGESKETVYRDKHGRRISTDEDLSRHRKTKKKRIEIDEKEQLEWGKGRAQIQAEEEAMRERSFVQNESFARFKDDVRLDQEKKEIIRKGDPMAAQALKKQVQLKGGREKLTNYIYKGPEPKPNRFNIRPGYRWDGVDRGNGFEDKVLACKYSKHRKKEDAYRWSSADM